MKFLNQRSIAIVSFGEARNVKNGGLSALELAAQVATEALARVGMDRTQVDGLALTTPLSEGGDPFWSNLVAETLGFSPTWLQTSDLGGASAVGSVARAAAAIHAGQCEVALCIFADAPSTQYLARQGGHRTELADPSGWAGPTTGFGLLGSVYRERYGWPDAALAKLAVSQRNAALLNPNACASLQAPLSVEKYLDSKIIADPLRLLDCVMRCDGANAVLVTSTDAAIRLGIKRWIHPVAYRELTNPDPLQVGDDLLKSGFGTVGPAALADADMVPSDVKMLQAYDDFLIAVMLQLEEIGFCGPGEAADFVMRHDFSHRGSFPLNTGGGQISAGQCGLAGGGTILVEAVRQMLFQAGERQVADSGNAMVTGLGVLPYAGNWGTSSVLILAED